MFLKTLALKNRLILFFVLLFTLSSVYAHKSIQDVRVWSSAENTRVILDLSSMINYKIFTLEDPHRVIIDIEDAKLKTTLKNMNFKDSKIVNIRYAHKENELRIVLDMKGKVKHNSFLLGPNQIYGNRLVIDLSSEPMLASQKSVPKIEMGEVKKRFVVAIDPGHGGDDTGAIGRKHQVQEKDVVFAVSKKLQALINNQPGMHAFLIRSGDYYVGLRKRMELARKEGADLFISIHADSFKDPRASGASVFVLSEKGASNEAARWLAERENRSDLVGGVKLEDKGDLLASVLLDLSQTASQQASSELAMQLISNLAKVTTLHHKTVQRAGFLVLKSPDIPSVLVELGFISNHHGEEKLLNSTHQHALANALLGGIKAYAGKHNLRSTFSEQA